MSTRTLERFTMACVAVAVVLFVASPIVVMPAIAELLPRAVLMPLASAIMLATLAIQLSFLLIQFVPDSRRVILLPRVGGDAWFFILVVTMMPAVSWHDLAKLADPVFLPLGGGVSITLITALVLSLCRLYQLRRQGAA